MIELTSEVGELITVDGGIEITVTGTQGDYAKLKISTPKELKVYRKESLHKIKEYISLPYS